jgi:type II secretory ATPase GspE/PulE/Tfp pilus assembly ATPase PilB-like protein
LRASDIHIETFDARKPVRVRLRIDGELLPYLELPARLRFAMVARSRSWPTWTSPSTASRRTARSTSRAWRPPVELRVVTVPTSRGLEDVVLRLLGAKPLPLEASA